MQPIQSARRDQGRERSVGVVSRRSLLQAAATAALLSSSKVSAQSTPETTSGPTLSIPLYPYGHEVILDPHRATNWGPHWVMLPNVWAGLLGFDENGAVAPVLATSVDPEEDGRVWVASIRPDATFASGNPVTAPALIDGWKRALSPQRLAPMSTYMRRVDGYDAFTTGDSEEIGFEARDDRTVAIRLSQPYSLFPEDLATFIWAAVDVTALDGVPESQAPFAGASAGLWTFAESSDAQTIRMVPNDHATGLPASFTTIDWALAEGPQAADATVQQFSVGAIPLADVPDPLRKMIEGDASLSGALKKIEPSGTTMLIGMDYRQAPFDNPDVRKAVALSIDRGRWASEIMGGAFVAATGITPPVLQATAGYTAPELPAFDADAAKKLLSDAGITTDTMPPVTYYQPAESSQAEFDQAAALLAMIQENSGLIIDHDTSRSAEQIDALRKDNGGLQFDIRWWWPLTSSPSGLADLALPDSPSMDGWFNWSTSSDNADIAAAAKAFTTAITDADTAMDVAERNQLFARAEEILVQHSVFVPLGHWVQAYLQSPALTGTRQGAFTGYLPVAFDESVDYTPAAATPSA